MRKKRTPVPPGQPTREAFVAYAREKKIDEKLAGDQWDVWDAGDWCDNGGNPILNWKGKLLTFVKCGFGVFGQRNRPQQHFQQRDRSRAAEAQEEYEERQRYKPKDL